LLNKYSDVNGAIDKNKDRWDSVKDMLDKDLVLMTFVPRLTLVPIALALLTVITDYFVLFLIKF
jgi:hypothetical protein